MFRRHIRKIRQLLYRLRIQETVWHGDEQRPAHQLPQRHAARARSDNRHYLPEHRTPRNAGVRPSRRVRRILQKRKRRILPCRDAERRTAVL